MLELSLIVKFFEGKNIHMNIHIGIPSFCTWIIRKAFFYDHKLLRGMIYFNLCPVNQR